MQAILTQEIGYFTLFDVGINMAIIVMRSKGLGLTEQDIGSVAKKVLRLTRKPVIFL